MHKAIAIAASSALFPEQLDRIRSVVRFFCPAILLIGIAVGAKSMFLVTGWDAIGQRCRVVSKMSEQVKDNHPEHDAPPTASGPVVKGLPHASQEMTAVAEWVADVIRNRIIKGELESGDRIIERRLSTELNVSRTPIREALKLLRADGLVEISRNCGAQVTTYTAHEARDLFDAISALESLAAQRLAERLTDNMLDQLEFLHARMKKHFRNAMLEPYFEANSAIHDFVIAECGNAILADSHARLILRAKRGRFMAILDDTRWAQAVSEHDDFMIALRRRDAQAARAVWGLHLRHTGDTVAEMLSKGINDSR